MTVRTTFLQLQIPSQPLSLMTLNCTSWVENEFVWLGGAERSAANLLLQTLNRPKREWSATVEFPDFSTTQAFIAFIATEIASATGKPTGLRPLNLLSTGAHGALRRFGAPVLVLVQIIRLTPWSDMVAGAGPVETEIIGWTADITLMEI